jgi:hypothetical protein
MSSIPIVRLAPTNQWDQTILNRLFDNTLCPTGLTFRNCESYPIRAEREGQQDCEGIILVIPGRYWYTQCNEISEAIRRYDWVLGIRTGDEEDLLDVDQIYHPNIRWWVQTPRTDHDYGDVRKLGVGFTPHFNELPYHVPDKALDIFLAGQRTHERRDQCFAQVQRIDTAGDAVTRFLPTEGFTQGMPPDQYAYNMRYAKIAPAPAGPASPDSFRLYEALEAHCVPIADAITPAYDSRGYWEMVFPDATFPVVTDWGMLPYLVDHALANWPANSNRIAAWWMRQKRQYVRWLQEDLSLLGADVDGDAGSVITAVIPVSPIPSHPGIAILEETVESIRECLPDSEIIITFDGVRPEQESMRADYEEAMRRTLWRADHRWKNVTPLIFEQHQHQSGMMHVTLQHIQTPLLIYVEQDCPIVTDEPIEWDAICGFILDGHADLIRLHHEALILDVHKHLMQEHEWVFARTTQWSQRPHIASKVFYEKVMSHFSAQSKAFIEERMARVAQEQTGFKLWIYHPDSPNIKRSYTLDGRAGGPQFIDSQVF